MEWSKTQIVEIYAIRKLPIQNQINIENIKTKSNETKWNRQIINFNSLTFYMLMKN